MIFGSSPESYTFENSHGPRKMQWPFSAGKNTFQGTWGSRYVHDKIGGSTFDPMNLTSSRVEQSLGVKGRRLRSTRRLETQTAIMNKHVYAVYVSLVESNVPWVVATACDSVGMMGWCGTEGNWGPSPPAITGRPHQDVRFNAPIIATISPHGSCGHSRARKAGHTAEVVSGPAMPRRRCRIWLVMTC